jgi:Putative Flp pilus-assembly TadE/G-like
MNPMDRFAASRGQSLVLMVIGLTAIIIAVALTIDGGNAMAQQRAVQNGTDGGAIAGAVALGNHQSCAFNSCAGPTDGDVKAAIDAAAADNNAETLPILVAGAWYTDVCGTLLKPDGTQANDLGEAAEVGVDGIPPDIGNSANCSTASLASGPPAGVHVLGHVDSPTYIASAIGISTFAIDTQATAVSTYGACGAAQGCGLLPIGIPTDITTCDGGDPVHTGIPWIMGVVYRIPLCNETPGQVNWLDWDPPPGGTQDLIKSILTPDNSPITFPSWQWVSQNGNVNAKTLETELRKLDGKLAHAPWYEHTCSVPADSRLPAINTAPDFGCPPGELDQGSPNPWWRLVQMIGFQLCDSSDADCVAALVGASGIHGAYINSNNLSDCNPTSTSGGTSCLVGKFVDDGWSGTGADGAPVQLIK